MNYVKEGFEWVLAGLIIVGMAAVAMAVVVGAWLLGPVIAATFIGIPVWLIWNWLAPVYLSDLPVVYTHLGYMHVAGLIFLVVLLKRLFTRKAVK